MKVSKLTFLVIFVIVHVGFAQHDISEKFDFERVIEDLLPPQETDVDYNDFYDRLFSLYTDPMDINTAKRADFQSFFFLTETQISELIDYRVQYGNLLSIFELLTLESFDHATVRRLEPFVSFHSDQLEAFSKSLKDPDIHDLFVRYQSVLEQKKGYTVPDTSATGKLSSRYAGGPQRLYSRYHMSKPGRYSLGFTLEKDPGEKFIWDRASSRYGMDYYSFHVMIENVAFLSKIIVGDFSLDFGQGLVFGSGLSFGKGVESITTVRRNNLGMRPYRSVFEDRDYSGAAVSSPIGPFSLNLFFSNLKRDAIIREDIEEGTDQYFSSIQTIGLHRTSSEIAAKKQLGDRSVGGNLSFVSRNRKTEVGVNMLYTTYSIPQLPNTRNYNQFDFSGTINSIGSGYFNYHLKRAHIFGEFAVSRSRGKAITSGVIASLSSQVQASLHIRQYDRDFHSFYGNAFGENSRIVNENGIYWGLKLTPIRKLILTTYLDLFSFPWMKYRVDRPSSGNDFMIAANYQFNSKLSLRIQLRNKRSEINNKIQGRTEVMVVPKTSKRIFFTLKYDISQFFSIQSRVQGSNVKLANENSTGFMLAQDLNMRKGKFAISARFALFDTDSYDSRQFIYERDLLYLYSVPAFSNKGARYYLLTSYKVSKNVELWLKISQTKYLNQDTIGSGLEEINGDTKTSINAQLRLRI